MIAPLSVMQPLRMRSARTLVLALLVVLSAAAVGRRTSAPRSRAHHRCAESGAARRDCDDFRVRLTFQSKEGIRSGASLAQTRGLVPADYYKETVVNDVARHRPAIS